MAYEATYRFAIIARKVRPLADLIRGKFADDALDILKYQPHRGARMLEKTLHCALANAEDRRATEPSSPGGDRLPSGRRADVQTDAAARPRHGFGPEKRFSHIHVALE